MGRKLEERDPAKALRILEKLADPLRTESLRELARSENITDKTLRALWKRNEGVMSAHLSLNGDENGSGNGSEVPDELEGFLPMLKRVSFEALNMTREDLEKASPAQRGVLGGIAFDKAAILEGRATMNVSVLHEHRHDMDSLGEALADALRAKSGELPDFIEAETE